MPEPTDSGVLDSTADDSKDIELLNAEDENLSSHEEFTADDEKEDIKEPDKEEKEEDKEEEKEEKEEPKAEFPYDRPTMQQLREAFPDIFKKFPVLRDIYYREQEFSQIFPTIEDAKEASSNASAFADLSSKVLNGDAGSLFSAIKEVDEKAVEKISETFLPSLYKISPDLHWKATLPLLQNIVRGFHQEGQRRKDENIINAADYLSDFVFGDVKVARGERDLVPRKSEDSEEKKELDKEKAKFYVDRFDSFSNSIKSRADEDLKNYINEKGKIDPDNIFSDFIKETIINKIYQEVDKQLVADKNHMKYMGSLWDKAKSNGFSDDWKSRILSAYLARAKSLVPAIRAKFISEAMGSSSRASEKRREVVEKTQSRREPGQGGRPGRERNGNVDARDVDWDRTSDLDLLNDNITYRRK